MKKLVVIFGALCLMSSLGGAALAKERIASEAQGVQRMKAAGSGGSSAKEEVCHGAGACRDMLDRVGTCKHLSCNTDVDGKPSCTCEL